MTPPTPNQSPLEHSPTGRAPREDFDLWYSATVGRVASEYPADAQLGWMIGHSLPICETTPLGDREAAWSVVERHSASTDVYVGVVPRNGQVPPRSHGDAEHMLPARCLWLDIDIDKPGYPNQTTAEDIIAELPIRPHCVVRSGVGFHVYHMLSAPLQSPVERCLPYAWDRLAKSLHDAHGVQFDKGITTQTTRILRPAGSVHRKVQARPLPVAVWSWNDGPLYSPDEVRELCPDVEVGFDRRRIPTADDDRVGTRGSIELPISRVLDACGWTVVRGGV